VQIFTAGAWLTRDALPCGFTDFVSAAMVWPCAAMAIWSGVHYGWRVVHNWRIDAPRAQE
jgi:hypothetical protein